MQIALKHLSGFGYRAAPSKVGRHEREGLQKEARSGDEIPNHLQNERHNQFQSFRI